MVIPKPEKIEIDFTDAKLTGMAGSLFIARLANQLKLPDLLDSSVTRRWHDGKQWLLEPEYGVILVSRSDLSLDDLVRRHREKQGQENAQKGPLIDLDLHHPPCKKFHANQAFYACGQIAQILLRALQYKALPKTERKHGIRPLIRKIVRSVGRLTCSGRRKWTLHFVKTTVALEWLWEASKRLDVRRTVVST